MNLLPPLITGFSSCGNFPETGGMAGKMVSRTIFEASFDVSATKTSKLFASSAAFTFVILSFQKVSMGSFILVSLCSEVVTDGDWVIVVVGNVMIGNCFLRDS
jgi:hypothetical protein